MSGPYTARAVAAIAFRVPVGAVDTNVRRVLGRIAAGGPEAFPGASMQALADATVPPDRPDAWTHALMDLGARLCRPARPRCADCPAIAWCRYAAGERAVAGSPGPCRLVVPCPPSRRRTAGSGAGSSTGRGPPTTASWIPYHEPIGSTGTAPSARRSSRSAARACSDARDTPAGMEARLPR